jgi:hypothetical protein
MYRFIFCSFLAFQIWPLTSFIQTILSLTDKLVLHSLLPGSPPYQHEDWLTLSECHSTSLILYSWRSEVDNCWLSSMNCSSVLDYYSDIVWPVYNPTLNPCQKKTTYIFYFLTVLKRLIVSSKLNFQWLFLLFQTKNPQITYTHFSWWKETLFNEQIIWTKISDAFSYLIV